MTPKRLTQIGMLLFGEYWKGLLARELAVAPRTVQRWAAGGGMLGFDEDLARLCRKRAEELIKAADEIDGNITVRVPRART